MPRKILVILGQPQRHSYGGALAKAYADGAREAGAEVKEIYLGELKFNPLAVPSLTNPAELEPDLKSAQEAIKWADHLVFVYPIWWGTIPALLKGFIERTFQEGFSVKFHEDSIFWDKLLKGRSARLIVTLNTPWWYYRWILGQPGHNTMKKTILEFCGVSRCASPRSGRSKVRRRRNGKDGSSRCVGWDRSWPSVFSIAGGATCLPVSTTYSTGYYWY